LRPSALRPTARKRHCGAGGAAPGPALRGKCCFCESHTLPPRAAGADEDEVEDEEDAGDASAFETTKSAASSFKKESSESIALGIPEREGRARMARQ